MSRKWINLTFLLISCVLVVWALATLVRESDRLEANLSVPIANALVFGVPLFLATFVAGNVIFTEDAEKNRVATVSAFIQIAVFIVFSLFVSAATLAAFDEWRAQRYLEKVTARLAGDSRYGDVRVLGLSRSYLLFPYHPVSGTVETEEDRIILNRLLGNEWTPGYVSTGTVRIKDEESGGDR